MFESSTTVGYCTKDNFAALDPVAEFALEFGEGLVRDLRYPAQELPVGDERGGVLDDRVLLVFEAADEPVLEQRL